MEASLPTSITQLRPKKILLVSPYLYPKIGGVERYVYELAKQLKADPAYKVYIVTVNTESNRYEESELEGIPVYRVPARFKISNTPIGLSMYRYMRNVITKVDPDIVHAHAPVPVFADVAALCSRGRKFVLTYHAGSLKKGSWPIDILLGAYERFVLPRLFARADAITTVSAVTRDEMMNSKVAAAKTTIIPPGVHLPRERAVESDSKTITYVGRVDLASHWKGIDTLLEAFATVVKQQPQLSLEIVGEGNALAYYKERVNALGIVNRVVFAGSLSGMSLADAYRRSSVVVLPSTSSAESFGLVLLEAMAYGVPVIGSKIGGIVNVITDQETGLLVPPGNSEALAAAILKLLFDPYLRATCVAGGLVKAEQHTWEIQTEKMVAVYETTLKKPPYKVLQVVPAYPPSLGGMEERVKELVYKLKALGIQLEVVTSSFGTVPSDTIEDGVRIRRIKKLSFINTPISFRLPIVLWCSKADIFHLHVAQPFYPIIGAIVAKLRRKPYILHIRAIVESQNFFGKLFIAVYKKIPLRLILRMADHCIIMTDTYRKILTDEYGVDAKKIVTIPNATSFSVVEAPKTLPTQQRTIRLLAVGRIDKQKNYHFMLRVLKVLLSQGNFHLTIVGTGAQTEELQAYVKELGVADFVTWAGRLEGSRLEALYEDADIFIHTAHFESFGTVFIEAMTKGLPICATRVLGAIDVVKDNHNGLLSSFSETDFATLVQRIATDPQLYTALSSNNLKTVKGYRWDRIIEQTVAIYERLHEKK